MYDTIQNGQNGENRSVATSALYSFKYVETTWIDGREISNPEKTWNAENLNDYDRFQELWQELEAFDEHYQLTEVGSLMEDGNVSMVLEYTLETDYQETIKYIRGISYEIA